MSVLTLLIQIALSFILSWESLAELPELCWNSIRDLARE